MLREHRHTVREWFAARDVIVAFLRDCRPDLTPKQLEMLAAGLIARLASHEPPILLDMAQERGE